MEIEEKFLLSLEKAQQQLQTADHLIYMTFPLIKENKLLLKALEEIYSSILNTINTILQYEYAYKRIHLYSDAKENFRIFKAIAPRYSISQEQMSKIIEIMAITEKHKKSPFEFVKQDKIVIMSEGMKTDTITLETMKDYLIETKNFLKKVISVVNHA